MKQLGKLSLSKSKLKTSSDLLTDEEMKMITGGAMGGGSGYCHSGEYMYYCYIRWQGGAVSAGYVCAMGASDARALTTGTLSGQGFDVGGDIDFIYCQ